MLVVPSPLPSEVTPSLSQSPPSLRGEPLLGGQSTYGSPTQGPPALLLKLLGGGEPTKITPPRLPVHPSSARLAGEGGV